MTKPYAYGRVVMGGAIGSADTWSCGWSFGAGDFADPADLLAMLTGMTLSCAHWMTTGSPTCGTIISSDTNMIQLRAYYYNAGSHSADAQAEYNLPTLYTGQESAVAATKMACVATLLTGAPGRSGKGRMYIPADGATLSSHQFQGSDVDNVAGATAALLQAFNDAGYMGGLAVACVATKTDLKIINAVRVDSLPDSQRRRQNKLASNHQDQIAITV